MFRFMLFTIVVLLSGCGGGKCIEPGAGISSDQEIKVPVMPEGADSKRPASYWVNSGYYVDKKDVLKITVDGTIDFCPLDSSSPPVLVKMYSDGFSEANEPYYDTHIDVVKGDRVTFSAFQYDLNFPTCEKIVYEHSPIIYYDDSSIFTDSNCTNSIAASKICSAGAESKVLTDVIDSRKKRDFLLHVKVYEENRGSASYRCEKLEDIIFPKVGGSTIRTPRLQFPIGYIAEVQTEGSATLLAKGFVTNGYVHDARTIRTGAQKNLTKEICPRLKDFNTTVYTNLNRVKQIVSPSGQDRFTSKLHACSGGEDLKSCMEKVSVSDSQSNDTEQREKEKIAELLKEYTEYDINCHCGKICTPGRNGDCISTIVNISHDGKVLCPTPERVYDEAMSLKTRNENVEAILKALGTGDSSDNNIENIEVTIPGFDSEKFRVSSTGSSESGTVAPAGGKAKTIAQGVRAIIKVSTSGTTSSDIGSRDVFSSCGNGSNASCENLSEEHDHMELDYPHEVKKNGRLGLAYIHMLGAGADNEKLRGFYAFNVHRSCYASGGKKLYMYVGDSSPAHKPGDRSHGFTSLDMDTHKDKGFSYTINSGDNGGEKKKGYVYFGIDVDPGYEEQLRKASNAENYYTVRLRGTKSSPLFSTFFGYLQGVLLNVLYGSEIPQDGRVAEISESISKALDGEPGGLRGTHKKIGAVQQIYNNQVMAEPFWTAVRALLTLYLMFSVLGYIIGVVQVTKYDLGVRIAKIAFILLLVSKGSWEFFNEHCFRIFTVGLSEIISAFNGHVGGDASFAFLDSTLGLFLTSGFWVRMLALFGAGPVGWLMFFGLIWALWAFFLAMMRGIIMYLFVIVALAFLVTLAPLFITFLLFQITRSMFDAWIKMIVNFSLQPIILFASLAFLNQIILVTMHGVTDFTACESCILGFDISSKDPKSPGKKDICILPAMLPIGFSSDMSINDRIREEHSRTDVGFMGLPFSVTMLFILILACKATREFGQIAEVMAHSISGSVAGVTASFVGATQAMLGVVGMDTATQHLISSARGMTPVGTDKLHFQNEESSQPRHDGTDYDPGEKPAPSDDGSGSDNSNNGGVDVASGGSVSGVPGDGHDVISGGTDTRQRNEGDESRDVISGDDERYVPLPTTGISAYGRELGGGGQSEENVYSEIDEGGTAASTGPEDTSHLYEEIDQGAETVFPGSTESLHLYEEIDDFSGRGTVHVEADVMQNAEEISGGTHGGADSGTAEGDALHGLQGEQEASDSGAGLEGVSSTESSSDTGSDGISGLQFEDLLASVEGSPSGINDGIYSMEESIGDIDHVEEQSKSRPTIGSDTMRLESGERNDQSVDDANAVLDRQSFSDRVDSLNSPSSESGDRREFGADSDAHEKEGSLDEKLSKRPDNDPTEKDTRD